MIRPNSSICRSTSFSLQSNSRCSSSSSHRPERPSSSTSAVRYRIKANRSTEVDELLFGSSSKVQRNRNNPEMGVCDSVTIKVTRPQSASSDVYLCNPISNLKRQVEPENIRYLYLANNKPKEKSLLIKSKEFQNIVQKTLPIREKSQEEHIIQYQKELLSSQERRQNMRQFDIRRIQKETLSDMEIENKERARRAWKKALDDRVNNEEEIRQIDVLIKEAKLQDVREKQIEENKLLQKEREEEERRLDNMVERERLKDQAKIADRENIKLQQEYKSAQAIYDQIQEHQNQRLHDMEEAAQESLARKQAAVLEIEHNESQQQLVWQKQLVVKQQFAEINLALAEKRKCEQMKDQLINQAVMQYQLEKEEKERKEEEELQEKRKKREIEYAKMRAMQEREIDLQSKRDEIIERRAWEEEQRKWRESELKDAQKQQEKELEIQNIRIMQKKMKDLDLAIQASREKAEFQYNVDVTKKLLEQEKLEIVNQQTKKNKYIAELNKQVQQNYVQRRVDLYEMSLETEFRERESRFRRERIEEAKKRKINELREAGVSVKFLAKVENLIKNPVVNK